MAETTEQALVDMMSGFFSSQDNSKFNIAIGFFAGTGTTLTKVNLNLHYKEDNEIIDLIDVPVWNFGSQNGGLDIKFKAGDKFLVLFADKSIEELKNNPASVIPVTLDDKEKDDINFAFCIPLLTVSTAKALLKFEELGLDISLLPGQKIKIGDGANELLQIIFDLMTALEAAVPASGIQSALITAQKIKLQNLLWISS